MHGRPLLLSLLLSTSLLIACSAPEPPPRLNFVDYTVEEKSITELQQALSKGELTSVQLVELYLMRIATLDRDGPQLNSVLSLNPQAMEDAKALDDERASKGPRGPLHGIPLLLKDNIESADPMPTTAGSLALKNNLTERDAHLVQRLRAAGAIILGKTNLSEWANIRSRRSASGWSALGGLTRNPYAIDRSACGSSSGSGAATAASFAAASIGTETDGSITCPAAINGLVGLKPTLGLISRNHIIPVAHSQDSAGPMARSVSDAAILLTVMAGSDPDDVVTVAADLHKTDYSSALQAGALRGKRIGVLSFATGYHDGVDAVFEQTLDALSAAGASLVPIEAFSDMDAIGRDELTVLLTELKIDLNRYLASSPAQIPVRNLQELIAFNEANAEQELSFFGQDLFEQAQRSNADSNYLKLQQSNAQRAGRDGLAKLMQQLQLDAVIAPTTGPAWSADLINGDHLLGAISTLPAVAGYPHLTVPMGQVGGLPVGLSWIGLPWSEASLLAMAYDFEQRTTARKPPTYVRSEELQEQAAGWIAIMEPPPSEEPRRIFQQPE